MSKNVVKNDTLQIYILNKQVQNDILYTIHVTAPRKNVSLGIFSKQPTSKFSFKVLTYNLELQQDYFLVNLEVRIWSRAFNVMTTNLNTGLI